MSIGIYRITNKITNQFYIGASIEIERRWRTHKTLCLNKNHKTTYWSKLYVNMREYGVSNFSFEIIEETSKKELRDKERYYIDKTRAYDSVLGLNNSEGGESVSYVVTEYLVRDIRTRYANKERKREVYKDYKNIIGKSGFHKIWNGETWSDIMPEVFTEDNKNFHKHNTSTNGRSKISERDVYDIRIRKKNGEKLKEVYLTYEEKMTLGSFENIWYNQNWKKVIV